MKLSNDIEIKQPSEVKKKSPFDSFKIDSRDKVKTFDIPTPAFQKDATFLTLGSCFAFHIRNSLSNLGLKTNDLVFYDDEITTTLAMKEHFEWIVDNKELSVENIHARKGTTTLNQISNSIENYRSKSLNTLTNCNCVIMTFGLSETWINELDNRSVWRWPGKDKMKSNNFNFKLLSTSENRDNIKEIVKLIRKVNQTTAIVMTLSPIPLSATFRKDYKVNIANCASKARIRSAIDEFFVENKDENIFYWPSYEYVTQHPNPWEDDQRHVKPELIKEIMKEFIERVVK